MSRWIKLVDAMQQDAEMYLKYINYTPINSVKSVILPKEKTGWKEDQALTTEELQWHPVLIDGKPCLIGENSANDLYLQGAIGSQNRGEVFAEYCKLYDNEDLKTTVIPLNEKILNGLPDHIKNRIGDCWLDDANDEHIGVKSILFHKIHKCILFYKNAVSGEQYQYYAYPMCVVAQLPEDILVNMDDSILNGSCNQRALKISINECKTECEKEQKSQEKLITREMMMKEIAELDTKQLKDLYQYVIMFMKERP